MNSRPKVVLRWIPPSDGGRQLLPSGPTYSTVSRFEHLAAIWPHEAWSLVIEFDETPRYDVETAAHARFLVPNGPPDLLRPGSRFELLEGERVVAIGRVVEDD